MNTTDSVNSDNPALSGNALSIYSAGGNVDDFPVLKAFQQYIDAEQAKARKRMIQLCMFFGVLMAVLVAIFGVLIGVVNQRNQALNDRLIEYAMKDRERIQSQVANPAPSAANDAALKAMTATLAALQDKLAAAGQAKTEDSVKTPSGPSRAEIERQRTLDAQVAKIEKAQALLELREKQLAKEQEALRQQQIEQQRRRLYPECYEDSAKPAARKQVVRKPVAAVEDDGELDEDDASDEDDDLGEAIEYFKDDEYTIPVDVKSTTSGWSVPIK